MTDEEKKQQEAAAAAAASQEGTQQTVQQPTAQEKIRFSLENEADLDRRMTEMLMKDAQEEREREEKRLQRQAAARSLSDLGGVFVDMIKASEGAVVSPRTVEQHYQRLDDKAKQVVDGYRARVDLLRKQQADRDRARGAEQRAAAMKEEEMQMRMKLAAEQEAGKNARAAEAAQAKILAAQERARTSLKTRTAGNGEQEIVVPFAGVDYPIQKKVYDGRMAQLYAYLKQNNLFSKDSGADDADLRNVMALFQSNNISMADESSKAKLAIANLVSISELPADSEHAANIISILKGTYGKSVAAPAQAAADSSKGKKKIAGINGN